MTARLTSRPTAFAAAAVRPSHSRAARRRRAARRGAMLVLVAVMMLGFMVAVAFSVDVAQMHLARTELRTATDAAAKATAGTLADSQDMALAIDRGREIAAENTVAGTPLLLESGDFEFGHSQPVSSGAFEFHGDQSYINSVRVRGRRTAESPSGVVPLFFGNLMGFHTFEPTFSATATYIERDVVLVVDRSGSMQGTKFQDLRGAIDLFLETLGDTPVEERVGLASYSSDATEDVQLTVALSDISAAMDELNADGQTSISAGIGAGGTILDSGRSAQFVERTLIVMTDGLHNTGPEPRDPAQVLGEDGVTIHTITFGSGADTARMREVAELGGGRHFHADDGLELHQVYREIALTLSTIITE